MSLNRFAKKTDSSQEAIVKALRKAGVSVWILGQPVDLLYHWRGLFGLLECKPEGWKTWSKAQREQEMFCKTYKVPVVRTPKEALYEVGVIGLQQVM